MTNHYKNIRTLMGRIK